MMRLNLLPGLMTRSVAGLVNPVLIVSIKDKLSTEYHAAKTDANVKMLDFLSDQLRIEYRVNSVKQKVNLWVEYESSKIHDDFYKQYKSKTFVPPRVAWLVKDAELEPGDYYIDWDGRDQTRDLRLALTGKYLVKIVGARATWKSSHTTKLVVSRPEACGYGIHYKKGRSWESSKDELKHLEKSFEKLKDGTGFDVTTQLDRPAGGAMEDIQSAAVFYFGGHANPFGIVFHGLQGKRYSKRDRSLMYTFGRGQTHPHASIADAKESAFKDLFLIILNGCKTGNQVSVAQVVFRKFNPGPVDGDHGKKTIAALQWFQKIHALPPADGTKNTFTLQWFNISSEGKSEKALTREVQEKLRSYYAGKTTGKMNSATKKALKNYQTDHPGLKVTGEFDAPTLKALQIGDRQSSLYLPLNIADSMGYRGADIAIGFEHSIDFKEAETWAKAFVDNLVAGDGVNKAAEKAVAKVDQKKRSQFQFNIYAQEKVSKNTTLHPARFGRTTVVDI